MQLTGAETGGSFRLKAQQIRLPPHPEADFEERCQGGFKLLMLESLSQLCTSINMHSPAPNIKETNTEMLWCITFASLPKLSWRRGNSWLCYMLYSTIILRSFDFLTHYLFWLIQFQCLSSHLSAICHTLQHKSSLSLSHLNPNFSSLFTYNYHPVFPQNLVTALLIFRFSEHICNQRDKNN